MNEFGGNGNNMLRYKITQLKETPDIVAQEIVRIRNSILKELEKQKKIKPGEISSDDIQLHYAKPFGPLEVILIVIFSKAGTKIAYDIWKKIILPKIREKYLMEIER